MKQAALVLVLFLVVFILLLSGVFLSVYVFSYETPVSREHDCEFVSSRGLMRTCDLYPSEPASSTPRVSYRTWEVSRKGEILYVQGSAVPDFIQNMLPRIQRPFTLVTGDCDQSIPKDILTQQEFQDFVADDRLIHWFSQNLVIKHPKMTIIPIGLDYHSMLGHTTWGPTMHPLEQESELKAIARQAPPLAKRLFMCYSNFHFAATKDRRRAIKYVPRDLVFYEQDKTTRREAWKTQSLMAFVLSPRGNGYDCHRTWEALVLGCIPIIRRSPIDDVFQGLPVLLVDDWPDVNLDLLRQTLQSFSSRSWDMDRLHLSYWSSLIRNKTWGL